MQNKKSKASIQGIVLGIFLAMILACASSKSISDGITGGDATNPTSAELINESVDSVTNFQLPNKTDLANL